MQQISCQSLILQFNLLILAFLQLFACRWTFYFLCTLFWILQINAIKKQTECN